jgi:FlaA1/EpsC-like NDP-sugar epimerase
MLISESANLVLQTLYLSKGGDVFILNMGKPVLIKELAERMISLNGCIPKYDKAKSKFEIQIVFSGLSKGEKLYEELLIGNNPVKTSNPDIFKTFEFHPSIDLLNIFFDDIKTNMKKNDLNMMDKTIIDFLKKYDRYV